MKCQPNPLYLTRNHLRDQVTRLKIPGKKRSWNLLQRTTSGDLNLDFPETNTYLAVTKPCICMYTLAFWRRKSCKERSEISRQVTEKPSVSTFHLAEFIIKRTRNRPAMVYGMSLESADISLNITIIFPKGVHQQINSILEIYREIWFSSQFLIWISPKYPNACQIHWQNQNWGKTCVTNHYLLHENNFNAINFIKGNVVYDLPRPHQTLRLRCEKQLY